MGRVQSQPALKKLAAGVSLVCLLLTLLWWLWPASPEIAVPVVVKAAEQPAPRKMAATRVVEDLPLDPDLLKAAIQGEHGLELRNRICTLCNDGRLEDEACLNCSEGRDGRVNVDLVGTDGRPIPQYDGMVMASCRKGIGGGVSGHLDLPSGPCELRPYRMDDALTVRGDPVQVEVLEGEEIYQLLEVPAEPYGGVGVAVQPSEDGLVITGLIEGTAAFEAGLEQGQVLLEVDGISIEPDADIQDLLDLLVGPRGTEVKITVQTEDGEQEVTLDRRRITGFMMGSTIGLPG